MKLKPYPKYKDSEIQWIGGIPEGWKLSKGKFQFKVTGGYAFPSDDFVDEGVPLIRIGDITKGTVNLDNCKKLPEEYTLSKKDFLLKEKDVLVAMTGATIGKIGQVPKTEIKMLLNQRVGRIKINLSSDFYKYVLDSDFIQTQIRLIAEGSAQENISSEQIESFIIPDLNEKNREFIVNFLDKKTSEINKTIEKDKKLIALLKEKRTALINHVVTKGLDPDVKLKDSGIPWIGEIPEGWEVHKLKYKTIINKKKLEDDINPNYVINYLDISNVDSGGNILDIEEQIFEDAPSRARRIPRSGDTILSTVRTYLKAIAYLENIPGNLIVSTGFAVLEPIKSINSKYLFYSTSSEVFIQNVIAYSKGVAYPAINPPELGQIPIIMPSLPEQTTIVNFLDKATSKIDKTIKLIEQKLNLLEEYKKSSIHYVVSGKVDVRGVEA